VAADLHARRTELRRIVGMRGDARGVPEAALDELVDDAIRVVVMMRKPVVSEEHLTGAFWATARILLRQYREGRHRIRVGSRQRLVLDEVADSLVADDQDVAEVLAARELVALAADYVSQLSDVERDVMAVMAVHSVGLKATSRTLGLPLATVKAARRSARTKLDRIAVIAAAGRMCSYRYPNVVAYARGVATVDQERVARAHLGACASCRQERAKLVRELRGRVFQRDVAAVFLPSSVAALDRHVRVFPWLGRLVAPHHMVGHRAAQALGGAGTFKVASVASAIVVATATFAGVRPTLLGAPKRHPHGMPQIEQRIAAHTVNAGQPSGGPPRRNEPAAAVRAGDRLRSRENAELEFASPERPATGANAERGDTAEARGAGGAIQTSAAAIGTFVSGSDPALAAAREFGLP
jgi:hypothetical protein